MKILLNILAVIYILTGGDVYGQQQSRDEGSNIKIRGSDPILYMIDGILLGTDTISMEQKSFNYFVSTLDSMPFFCFDYRKFDKAKNMIFLKNETYKGRVHLSDLQLRPLNVLFNYDSISTSTKDNNSFFDTHDKIFQLNSPLNFISVVDKLPKKETLKEGDLIVQVSNHIYLNTCYLVRLDITCENDSYYEWMYVKLDRYGNPIAYGKTSAIR
jgi:hypothetical protein